MKTKEERKTYLRVWETWDNSIDLKINVVDLTEEELKQEVKILKEYQATHSLRYFELREKEIEDEK